MDKQLHLLETFRAREAGGMVHTVHAYEHLVRPVPGTDPFMGWEPTGLIEFRLDDGRMVMMSPDGSLHFPGSTDRMERLH